MAGVTCFGRCSVRSFEFGLRSIDKLTSDSADFEQLEQLFEPVLHNILLIWRYSKFYTTPTRLAVLIREICPLVVN